MTDAAFTTKAAATMDAIGTRSSMTTDATSTTDMAMTTDAAPTTDTAAVRATTVYSGTRQTDDRRVWTGYPNFSNIYTAVYNIMTGHISGQRPDLIIRLRWRRVSV